MDELYSMTNSTRKINLEGKDYILRIPGIGTEKLINRTEEYEIYQTIKDYHISDEVLYFDKDTGVKIAKFIPDSHNCDKNNFNDVKSCMKAIHHLHDLNLEVDFKFDLKERILFYEALMQKSKYEDYDIIKERIFRLLDNREIVESKLCLCHIDPNADNCLINNYTKEVIIVDWEYAAMQDPLLDVAMFGIYAGYTKSELDTILKIYTNDKYSIYDKYKYYTYIAAAGLLWSNWCEYKNQLGQTFGGEYELSQYKYAKQFSILAKEILRSINGWYV